MIPVLLVLLALAAQAPPAAAPPAAPAAGVAEGVAEGGVRALADTLRPLAPPDRVLDRYRADPDFQYDRPQAEGPSLWSRFWAWVWRTFVDPVVQQTGPRLWGWTLLAAAVLTLGWVVTRLLRAEGGGLFGRGDARRGEAGPLLDVEDIQGVDVRARLAEALGARDYRGAVRWSYLALLQDLAAAGVVEWRRDKTNRAYVAEARAHGASLGRAVARATRVFDYVWYGERPVDRARFEALRPLFEAAHAMPASAGTP